MRISTRISLLGVATVLLVGVVNLGVGAWSVSNDHARLLDRQMDRFEPVLRDGIDGEKARIEARLGGLLQDPTVQYVLDAPLDDGSRSEAAQVLARATESQAVAVYRGGERAWSRPEDFDPGPDAPVMLHGGQPWVVGSGRAGDLALVAARPLDRTFLDASRQQSGAQIVLLEDDRLLGTTAQPEDVESILASDGSWVVRSVQLGPVRAVGAMRAGAGNADYRDTIIRLLITGVLTVVVVGGLFLVVTQRLVRPLDTLSSRMQRLARGDLSSPAAIDSGAEEIQRLDTGFRTLVDQLSRISERLAAVGRGDLSSDVDEDGDLADSLRKMVESQRELVGQIAKTAGEIDSVAIDLSDTAYTLEEGAGVQASVVEETHRTMETLLASATRVTTASQTVQQDAEATHTNHETIEKQIQALTGHTERIGNVLEVIREIAARAEMLALNAALEGTRAGRAGRGFSLVATEMQTLTESISDAVRDIKQLTLDIQGATQATVSAVEEGRRRSKSSAQSAKQITLTIQQQRSGTQQVTDSMDEISRVINQTSEAAQEGATASEKLVDLAKRLQRLVGHFDL